MCWTQYKSQVFGIPSIQYLQWSAMATLCDAQSFCEPFGTYQWGMILQVQRNGLTLKGCGLSNLGWGRFKVIPPTGKFTKKKSLDGTPPQAVHDISSGVVQKQWLIKMVNKFSLLICKSQYFASCYTTLSCRLPVFALTALRFWPWHRSPMMASAAAPSGQDGWFHESVTSGFIQTILVYKHFKPFDSGAGEETKQSSPSSVWACLPTTRRYSQIVYAEWSRLDSCSQRPWGLSIASLF